MSSSGEIIIVLIGLALQTLMAGMKATSAAITSQDIIQRITQQGNAAGIRLSEFKDVMLSMLYANKHELHLCSSVTKMIHADVSALHREKISKAVRILNMRLLPSLLFLNPQMNRRKLLCTWMKRTTKIAAKTPKQVKNMTRY